MYSATAAPLGRGAGDSLIESLDSVPVLRPKLPSAERLLPYLQLIDSTRTYSNGGPLLLEFERRLCELLRMPPGGVAVAASGHAALVAAILAHAGMATPEKPLALIPSFTFCSTALAAEQCGYIPHLVDVDAANWQLDPQRLLEHPELTRAGLVMPVAAYGCPIRVDRWEDFEASTRVPTVIDAAAGFLAFADRASRPGAVPTVLSFHATKGFSTGEGGAVLSSDRKLLDRATARLNFGFSGNRDCSYLAFNGKLSEYHAAVGLASTDMWPQNRESWQRVANGYRDEAERAGIVGDLLLSPQVGVNHAFYRARNAASAERVVRMLEAQDIDTRFWYGRGLHRHTHFAQVSRDLLPVTESLCERLVGLPMAPDMEIEAIRRVVGVLAIICAKEA